MRYLMTGDFKFLILSLAKNYSIKIFPTHFFFFLLAVAVVSFRRNHLIIRIIKTRGTDRKCFNRFCLRSRSLAAFCCVRSGFFSSIKSIILPCLARLPKARLNNGHFVILWKVYINKLSAILFLYFLDVLVLLLL